MNTHSSGWLFTIVVAFLSNAASLPSTVPTAIEVPVQWMRRNGYGDNSLMRADIPSERILFDPETLAPAVQIGIGTPPQYFFLMFDTGSWITWIPSIDCSQQDGCKSPRHFLSKDSSTFEDSDSKFDGKYGSLTAHGDFFRDTVQVGDVSLANQKLAQVYQQTGTFANQYDNGKFTIDGIIGAGFGDKEPSIPFALYHAKLIPQPIFSVYTGAPGDITGSVIFGAVQDNKPLNTTAALDNQRWWYVNADTLSVNGDPLLSFEQNDHWLVDTGTATSRLLPNEAQKLVNKLFGEDATQRDVLYDVENCSKHLSQSWTITLTFPSQDHGTFDLDFTPADTLIKVGQDTCVFGFGIADQRFLGNSILQRYITTYDFGDKSIGFTLK